MAAILPESAAERLTPLERFVRDYIETAGGVWDEIEPQVYDVLLPTEDRKAVTDAGGREILQVTFDPEALPEHPAAQLASFGTPLVDRLLAGAIRRGRYAQVYWNGLNLSPHDLSGRIRRALTLPGDVTLQAGRVRALDFAQAVFWFEATFASDQKEDEIVTVAMDLHSGREVRHLERLLDYSHLAEEPSLPLPEARRRSVAAAYPAARREVLRTLGALANVRRRELSERLQRQVERMTRYYGDLRGELEEQVRRARDRGDDPDKFTDRREALDREEQLRVAELRQKSSLRVHLRLTNLLVVRQPKLLVRASGVSPRKSPPLELELVWDPLTESLEAASCPNCQRPTMAFEYGPRNRLVCPACAMVKRG